MEKRTWKFAGLVAIIGLLSGLIDWRYSTGFLLGAVVAVILYKRNERYWNEVVDTGNAKKGTGFTHFLVNYGLMALVLVLSAIYPNLFNIFACAAGLMLIKFAVVASELFKGKGKTQ